MRVSLYNNKNTKKNLKIRKAYSKAVNLRTDNTMAKRKKDKRTNNDVQNTTEKIKINKHEAHEKPR